MDIDLSFAERESESNLSCSVEYVLAVEDNCIVVVLGFESVNFESDAIRSSFDSVGAVHVCRVAGVKVGRSKNMLA
jgi:hypothetical protein